MHIKKTQLPLFATVFLFTLFSIPTYGDDSLKSTKIDYESRSIQTILDGTNLPNLLLENGLVGQTQYLLGVQNNFNLSQNMQVRGGKFDQNALSINGLPTLPSYYKSGFISALNPEVVGSLQFKSYGFDSDENNHLSSFTNLSLIGAPNKMATGSVSLSQDLYNIVGQFTVDDKFHITLAHRGNTLKQHYGFYQDSTGTPFGNSYNFNDFFAHLKYKKTPFNSFEIYFSKGDEFIEEGKIQGITLGTQTLRRNKRNIYQTGNIASGMIWKKTITPKVNSYLGFYFNNSHSESGLLYDAIYNLTAADNVESTLNKLQAQRIESRKFTDPLYDIINNLENYQSILNNSRISNMGMNLYFNYKPIETHTIKVGMTHNGLLPNVGNTSGYILQENSSFHFFNRHPSNNYRAIEEYSYFGQLYLQDAIQSKFGLFVVGLSLVNVGLESNQSLEKYFIPKFSWEGKLKDIKVGLYYDQNIQSRSKLQYSILETPFDFWTININDGKLPSKVHQITLNGSKELSNSFHLNANIYYKNYTNLNIHIPLFNLEAIASSYAPDFIKEATGENYGLELEVQKNLKLLSLSAQYHFSVANLTISDNLGVKHKIAQLENQNHHLRFILQAKPIKSLHVSAVLNIGSGVSSFYNNINVTAPDNVLFSNQNYALMNGYPQANLGLMHRLDIRASYSHKISTFANGVAEISVQNATFSSNPYGLSYIGNNQYQVLGIKSIIPSLKYKIIF